MILVSGAENSKANRSRKEGDRFCLGQVELGSPLIYSS